jgi:hypothetical protein
LLDILKSIDPTHSYALLAAAGKTPNFVSIFLKSDQPGNTGANAPRE